MKIFTPLALIICLYTVGCSTSKTSLESNKSKENLKNGTVLYIPKKTRNGLQSEMEFYFRFEEINYFVKFSESKVEPTELKNYINETILIEGTIKNGPWEQMKATTITSNERSEKPRTGPYITIDKIVDKNEKISR